MIQGQFPAGGLAGVGWWGEGHNQGQQDSSHDDFVFEGRIHELMTDTRVGVHTVACFCQVTASLKRITFDVSFVVDDGRSLLYLVTVKC